MTKMSIVLASDNAGKLEEFSQVLSSSGVIIKAQGELGVTPCEEPYITFVENALAKARHASEQTGLPALADDSGLCVDALNNSPGIYSARYAELSGGVKSDEANNQYLIQQLKHVSNRSASFVAVLVFVRSANDPRPIIVESAWDGEIIDTPKGSNGFGYDPIFYLSELNKTAAQLTPQIKNTLSHRGKALKKLLQRMQSQGLIVND